MAKIVEVDTGYRPRAWQDFCHRNERRFNVEVLHRRAGKTVMKPNKIIHKGLTLQRFNPQYAYVGPTYGQAKRVAWDYFKQFTKNLPNVSVNEAELRIDIPRPPSPWAPEGDRVRIMLLGAENPDSLRGLYLDGVVLDEYQVMAVDLFPKIIRPALTDREGWCDFIGTSSGPNHFRDMYEHAKKEMQLPHSQWFAYRLTAEDSKLIPQAELDEQRKLLGEETYAQEYMCDFAAPLVASYYGKELALLEEKGQITKVPYERNIAVDTYWDLGMDDSTTIWFMQMVGREIHVIDYLEDSGMGLEFYAKELKKKDYNYDTHFLPHDAAARELGTGVTREETLRTLKIGRTKIVSKQGLSDGIHAVRVALPNCWFDREKCHRGLEALRNYQRSWDSKNLIYSSQPKHDWSSHGADGFRTFATSRRPSTRRVDRDYLPRKAESNYDIFGG